jgi:hypothetical protein
MLVVSPQERRRQDQLPDAPYSEDRATDDRPLGLVD